MKRRLLATSALCALAAAIAAPAGAADQMVRKAPPPVKAPDWTGFYIGATAGEGLDSSNTSESWNWLTVFPTGTLIGVGGGPLVAAAGTNTFTTPFGSSYHHSTLGLIGGVEAGYNWQVGRTVWGLEGDFSGMLQNERATFSAQPVPGVFPPLPNFFFIPGSSQNWTSEEKLDWLTTLRTRLGWVQDTNLWYVTGGGAAARIETNYQLLTSPGFAGLSAAAGPFGPGTFAQFGLPGGAAPSSFGTTRIGWVMGGGVETDISRLLGWGPGWSGKLEYLFADLGTVNHAYQAALAPVCAASCAVPATGTTVFSSSIRVQEHIFRAGLNYRFGASPMAPVAVSTAVYKAPVKAPPKSDWTGFYEGLTLGGGMDRSSTSESWNWLMIFPTGSLIGVGGGPLTATTTTTSFTVPFGAQYHHSAGGVVGGAEAGYNWQVGRAVVGLEGDFSGTSQRETVLYTAAPVPSVFPPLPNFFFIPGTTQAWTSEEKLDWLATARTRVGWVQDSNLWYLTGGLAAGRIETNYVLLSSPGFAGLATASGTNGPGTFAQFGLPGGAAPAGGSTTRLGWVAGGGVETDIGRWLGWGPRWTGKIEYLFADLGVVQHSFQAALAPVCSTTCSQPAIGTTLFTSAIRFQDQILRVGVNYKLW
jgi:outer membrane immunogenic protein